MKAVLQYEQLPVKLGRSDEFLICTFCLDSGKFYKTEDDPKRTIKTTQKHLKAKIKKAKKIHIQYPLFFKTAHKVVACSCVRMIPYVSRTTLSQYRS